MQISYEAILKKMEEKLNEAKVSDSAARIREQVQSIKTLCEVLLEETNSSASIHKEIPIQKFQPQMPIQSTTVIPSTTTLSEKKIVMEDGANGDSLFDF
ncbi:YwdI family protein [Caldibacillus lycopersici]|uniref:YwdI family protein n=1 Tax=Perspicuibacillus lycopersici TaxID=1325689 RepID=A0AAE3ISF0_9BACI|nr:YwdI family protein [Perspicuibacillus lycopersici]MCU9613352.1 YwdI family protein [Perspicuibacillus lycopersici]